MKQLLRGLLVLVVLVAAVAPMRAQEAVPLKPYTDEAFGFTTVVPDGWTEQGGGLFIRGASATDVTVLAQQAVPLPEEQVLAAILPQLGLSSAPESIGTYESPALVWTLYKVEIAAGGVNLVVDFALASAAGKSYVVLLQTSPADYDALHESVFLPVLEALAPLVVEEDLPYAAEDVTFSNEDITLAGTLTLPEGEGPFPAVILVSGSGAQDRDESIAPVAAIKPFRLIADHLTRNGIAVLRYDDRGAGQSTGSLDGAISDFATDAAAAIDYLITREEIDSTRVGLLGHSEGAIVAALLAANDGRLAFVISLAGTAVSGVDALSLQNRKVFEALGISSEVLDTVTENTLIIYEAVLAGDNEAAEQLAYESNLLLFAALPEDQRPDDVETAARDAAAQQAALFDTRYLRELLSLNPGDDWAKTTIPVLAIWGGLDIQVNAAQNQPAFEAAMQAAGNTRYKVIVYPTANHLMQEAVTGTVEEYGTLKQEFIPAFLPDLTIWILETVG